MVCLHLGGEVLGVNVVRLTGLDSSLRSSVHWGALVWRTAHQSGDVSRAWKPPGLRALVLVNSPFEPIRVGDKIPNGELSYLDDDGKLQSYIIYNHVREKRVVFFGVPGAFTPTCSLKHVPGFIERAAEILDRGVHEIVCITVNDPWVVKIWEKTYPDNKYIKFLCDGSATWLKSLGLELDLIDRGMGVRSRRYCLFIDDSVVKIANIEEAGGLETSTADRMMLELEATKASGDGAEVAKQASADFPG